MFQGVFSRWKTISYRETHTSYICKVSGQDIIVK